MSSADDVTHSEFSLTFDLSTRMIAAVDNTAVALLTSTTILTVGNVVARFSRLGGRTVTGITPTVASSTPTVCCIGEVTTTALYYAR